MKIFEMLKCTRGFTATISEYTEVVNNTQYRNSLTSDISHLQPFYPLLPLPHNFDIQISKMPETTDPSETKSLKLPQNHSRTFQPPLWQQLKVIHDLEHASSSSLESQDEASKEDEIITSYSTTLISIDDTSIPSSLQIERVLRERDNRNDRAREGCSDYCSSYDIP
jgi:hypothetical protein